MRKVIEKIKKKPILILPVFIIFFLIIVGIVFHLNTFSLPIESISFPSSSLNYEKKDPGSFQVTKSAKLTNKGRVRVTIDMDTISLYNNHSKDVILVLDTSIEENIENIKKNVIEFTNQVLSNSNNKMALITYDEESIIRSSLTNDKETILNEINNLSSQKKMRSYYQAQLNIESILKEYQEEETREVEVLFLISGYPNADLPNHENYYKYLKEKYPKVGFHGIQYEMGDSILPPIKRISEDSFLSDKSNLSNVLLTVSGLTERYEKLTVREEINEEYFNIIKTTPQEGEVRVEENKVIWNIDQLHTGKKGKLTIDLEIKAEQEKNSSLISVSKGQEVEYKIGEVEEIVTNKETPKIYMTYEVSYKGNEPEGCNIENLPTAERKWAYEIIEANQNPICNGYTFLGWRAQDKEVEEITDNQYRMPEKDIELIGEWGKVSINKSMEGEVQPESTTIKGESILQILQNNELPEEYYTFEIEETKELYPVHIIHYEGNQEWTENQTFGNQEDISDGSEYAQKMVIVKVNGDLTIGKNVLVQPYYTKYGGPKGFLLYVTGKLTNNGTIDNSHGAFAEGQDVYLWHNTDGTYEYVPAVGGAGGNKLTGSGNITGQMGFSGKGRQTGGGGSSPAFPAGSSYAGGAGTSYSGGVGGSTSYGNSNPKNGSSVGGPGGTVNASYDGAGNPGSANGTGGLLMIYADEYINNGYLTANGATAKGNNAASPASSGGGSINVFINHNTVTTQEESTISTNTRYEQILGSRSYIGGGYAGSNVKGGAGGTGTINIGKIIDGQYYDLTDAIDMDREAYKESVAIKGESLLKIVESNDLASNYYYFSVTGKHEEIDEEGNSKQVESKEVYPVHFINYEGNQEWTTNQTFGDINDVGAASDYAQNMVIVKVNGDLTIGSNVLIQPYYTQYGGPKGFLLYVTGKLTNNGTIDNSHGAYAKGQDVYLWKNTDGTYEYVPAVGAQGGNKLTGSGNITGQMGFSGKGRQTGGGGSSPAFPAGSSYAGGAGTSYSGGVGGSTSYGNSNPKNGSSEGGPGGTVNTSYDGAGNPGSANGTGGLLMIYADEYINNGYLTANGVTAKGNNAASPASSGGGSINVFINHNTVTTQEESTISTNTRYEQILGSRSYIGGGYAGSNVKGGAGGTGTTSIGKIVGGQYYDLKDAIDMDREKYKENITIKGESLLKIVESNDLNSDYYYFSVTGKHEEIDEEGNSKQVESKEVYPVHFINYEGNQEWTTNQTFGDANDVGTANDYAQNMVIVKVNGDLTINRNVTVQPYFTQYGGPKGFLLYVTGKLTNNGTIDNSHGAYAEGQDVYLWKNTDETYEYVPAVGAIGGEKVGSTSGNVYGKNGMIGVNRQTGGGGSGGSYKGGFSGSGGTGTSYSGGVGGSTNYGNPNPKNGSSVGGPGGTVNTSYDGAGNPGSANGTGGLLTIYANEYINNGYLTANGATALGNNGVSPGSSGGGTINVFINHNTVTTQEESTISTNTRYEQILGNRSYAGGGSAGSNVRGGAGGTGTTNIGKIVGGQYYDLKDVIDMDREKYKENITIKGESILKIMESNVLDNGYYYFLVTGKHEETDADGNSKQVESNEVYPVHFINYEENQEWATNQTFGDVNDVGTVNDYARNMVIVKVNGDLTINKNVTVQPYFTQYGGPKGFLLYVTGKLTNNGTIDNSHGAFAEGQDVYLWKNLDGTYEYVPKEGAQGGASVIGSSSVDVSGIVGKNGVGRQTGGGGSGGAFRATRSGTGGTGTSYSGGSGGATNYSCSSVVNGSSVGGPGGCTAAGNPGGSNGVNGTGGLLIIYADGYENNGYLKANGATPTSQPISGGSSGGGSVNVFYTKNDIVQGISAVNGGLATGSVRQGGAGGTGTVTYTQIEVGTPSTQSIEESLISTPVMKIDNTNWTTSKEISITYPSGDYTNQYSLDLGTTWNSYTNPITLSEPTTVLSRSLDSSSKVVSSSSFKVTSIDHIEPEITLELPEEITLGEEYLLPTSYKVGPSGGKPICKVGENIITNTKELGIGTHTIICSIENGLGTIKSINKSILVKEAEVASE